MKRNLDICEACSQRAGSCTSCSDNPLKNKGEKMTGLDKKVQAAFTENYKQPDSEDDSGFEMVYRVTDTGIEQTPHSKLDEKVYLESQEKETIEETKNLSVAEKITEAFD